MADGADLADRILADPAAAWHALNVLDARDSFDAYCGLVELPGVVMADEPLTRDRKLLADGTWVDDDDDTGDVGDLPFRAIETPQAAHHKALIALCERLDRGETRRAMVFMPPGSAKSTYASVAFPSWSMGRHPGSLVGVATYATGLARKIGRRVRSIVRQRVYQEIFRTRLHAEQGAMNEWALTNGSEFMGEGILSGWTGNRLDGLVVDDPVKNREEADSPVMQAKIRGEFDDSLKSRLKPNAWVLLIQTRWNNNDLAGSILPEDWDGESGPILCRDGLVWEVLCIPAEAELNDPLGRAPGEMLWKEWFGLDPDFWTSARRNARTWSALYQQRPSPDEGLIFKREWFKRYRPPDLPKVLRKVGTSDYAVSENQEADYTVIRMWGVDHETNLWLLPGGYRAQASSDKWITAQIDLMEEHKPAGFIGEAGVIQKSIQPMLLREMRRRQVSCDLVWLPSVTDKVARARGFQGWASMGCVYIPEGVEGDAIIDEYLRFPAGKNDDDVDNGSLIGRALDLKLPATLPPAPPDPPKEMRGVMTLDEAWASAEPTDDRIR